METYSKEIVDELLLVYTSEMQGHVREWLEKVRHELLNWMETHPHKRLHSVRSRMKELSHLRDKIERWPQNNPADKLTKDNFFEKIEDLAGARVLVLYRHDVAIIDHFVYRSDVWRVLRAEANYDKSRPEDERLFEGLGFTRQTPERCLKPKENGYASIHYVLVKKTLDDESAMRSHRKCELQVRTIHEEAWGEFSHEFTYPHDQVDTLASNLIRRLSGLLHQAEDIVSDIRRSPADGRLFRKVHQQLWEGAIERLPPLITFDVVHEMLAELQFMTRSAPLAAVGILVEYGGTRADVERGKTIKGQEIITLGFGEPGNWSEDELQKLYLQAHKAWRGAGENDRNVFKFFVWSPPPSHNDGEPWIVRVPKVFRFFGDQINFRMVKHDAYKEVHRVLREDLKLDLDSGNCVERMQFFLWRTNNTHAGAKLPCRVGVIGKEVTGFYSPSPDPDLLGGMLWLPDAEDDEEGRISKALHAYADVLMAMIPRMG